MKNLSLKQRQQFIEKETKTKLETIKKTVLDDTTTSGGSIENFIGATQIPLGIAGPLKIARDNKDYYIPLATTEGALVASINRGCKVISMSGGATVHVENGFITRGPVFRCTSLNHAIETKQWVISHQKELNKVAEQTSSHTKLKAIGPVTIVGRDVFVRFGFDTADAMGMNMATIATEKIAAAIEKATEAKCTILAANYDIDKKPAWLNFIEGRGEQVWAEVTIPNAVIREVLKTTPQAIADTVYRKCLLGSAISGSIGFNAHFANVIAALFIATGQDPAHVVEGSLGVTTAEVVQDTVVFSIYMPSVLVGTVGGGTKLPTQHEALAILGLKNGANVLQLAKIVSGAVLAGELSLIASLAQGNLATAHKTLGRKAG